jgi:hypothetical protein
LSAGPIKATNVALLDWLWKENFDSS